MSTNEPILPAEGEKVKESANARNIALWSVIGVVVIVLGVVLYIFAYRQPAIEAGNEAIAEADRIAMTESNDSVVLAAYESVAAGHGFDAGNRAKLECAIILYRQGEYQKALDYVSDYDATDAVVAPLAYGLKGDCLVNLDRNSDALGAFSKAISAADNNPQLVPYFLGKKATVQMAEQKYADAVEAYKEIEKNYPVYAQRTGVEGRRLQAEALAAQK